MMLPTIVHCPYCGVSNSDEYDFMDLYKRRIWFLKCRSCGKESTLILYDFEEIKT